MLQGRITLLHTSDLHIEWLFERYPAQMRQKRRREILGVWDRLADLAVERQVAAVLVTGDLFHSPTPSLGSLAAVVATMRRLEEHGIKVVIIPGNHDPLGANSVFQWGDFPRNVHIFLEPELGTYDGIEGLTIHGAPYYAADKTRRLLQGFQVNRALGNNFQVAMLHGTFKGVPVGDEDYSPIYPEDIAESGFDYVALGHYHDYRDCSSPTVKSAYPGSPVRLGFGNLAPRRALIVTLDPLEGTSIEPVEIADRRYEVVEQEIGQLSLVDLYEKIRRMADPELCLKVLIEGITADPDLARGFSAGEISGQFAPLFFHLEVEDRTTVLPDLSDNLDQTTVKGIFLQKCRKMLEESPERRVVEEALRLGLRALRGGSL